MRTLFVPLALLTMGGPILAQNPPAPDPNTPVAEVNTVVSDPVSLRSPVFLDATTSRSTYPLKWKIEPNIPIQTLDQGNAKGVVGIILPNQLKPSTTYIVTITALGRTVNGEPSGESDTVLFTTEAAPANSDKPSDSSRPDKPSNADAVPVIASDQIFVTLFYPGDDASALSLLESPINIPGELAKLRMSFHAYRDDARAIVAGKINNTTVLQDLHLDTYYKNAPVYIFQRSDGSLLTGPDGKTVAGYGVVARVGDGPDWLIQRAKAIRGK